MSFAGKVWRLLVGIKDALALAFLLLFFTAIFAVLSSRPSPGHVYDGALLLDLSGSIVEEPAGIAALDVVLSGTLPTRQYRARDVVRAIDEAARDKRIKAIALDLTTFTGGGAVTMQEVGEALERFRQADKPILAYAVAYTDDAITLASHASEVWVDPMGGAVVRGPGGSIMFYGDALERFDINMHVYQVGAFKGTGEPYMRSSMSPEFRQNTEAYMAEMWDEYRAHVTQARPQADFGAATTGLVELMEANGGDLAKVAVATGFADTIGTREQWGMRLAELVGDAEWDESPGAFASTSYDVWAENLEPESEGMRALTGGKKRVGVVTVSGEISDGNAGPGSAGAARITQLLDDALDDDISALVVRVDSPGGTVTGSEAIRRAVLKHKAKGIPVAVSMGNYAASGGYWIATSGDRIFAEPETVTGSIGVILAIPSVEGILGQYGITTDPIRTTPLSGQPDLLGGFTPEADALLQAETRAIYGRFTGLVAKSRDMTPARISDVAQGRVWTGGAARQLGLVDQFGGLDAAMAWAAGEAGIEDGDWEPYFLAAPPDPFAELVAGMVGGSSATGHPLAGVSDSLIAQEQDFLARFAADFDRLMTRPGVRALCLTCLPGDGTPAPRRQSSGLLEVLATLLSRD